MGTQNQIALDVPDRSRVVEKVVLGSGIKPGHLCSVDTDDKISKLANGNAGLVVIPLEHYLSGGTGWGAAGGVFDAYTVGDRAITIIPRKGERYQVRVPANAAAILKHNILVPDPANPGTIVKLGGAEGGEVIGSVGPATAIVAADTAAHAYDVSVAIPANSLNVDDVIHIRASVLVIDNNGTDTLTLTLLTNATTLVTTPAIDVADNDVGIIDVALVVRSIGASGTAIVQGEVGLGVPGTATMRAVFKASFTLDTTIDHVITVAQTFSAAHADNEAQLQELTVSRANKFNTEGGIAFTADEALDNSANAAEVLINARVY